MDERALRSARGERMMLAMTRSRRLLIAAVALVTTGAPIAHASAAGSARDNKPKLHVHRAASPHANKATQNIPRVPTPPMGVMVVTISRATRLG